MCGLFHFNFKRKYDVSKSKSPYFLLNKSIKFDENETESKMENHTQAFRETKLVLLFIRESRIKGKTVLSWSSRKKKECIFSNVHFVQRKVF